MAGYFFNADIREFSLTMRIAKKIANETDSSDKSFDETFDIPLEGLAKTPEFRVKSNNLLHQVMLIPGVERVYLKSHGLEIGKRHAFSWSEIEPALCASIREFFSSIIDFVKSEYSQESQPGR